MAFLSEEDFELLKQKEMDYFGTAMMIHPQAQLDIDRIMSADEEEVINIAMDIANGEYDYGNYNKPRGR